MFRSAFTCYQIACYFHPLELDKFSQYKQILVNLVNFCHNHLEIKIYSFQQKGMDTYMYVIQTGAKGALLIKIVKLFRYSKACLFSVYDTSQKDA